MRNYFLGIFILTALFTMLGCESDTKSKLNIDVSSVAKSEVKIKRYGKTMFDIPQEIFMDTVMNFAKEFPLFFDGGRSDTLALLSLKSFFGDQYMRELNDEVQQKFPNLADIEDQLSGAMQHFKYYFPTSIDYKYYSYISGLDIQFPVKVADNNIVIGLDLYLGHTKVYDLSGFPKYKSVWLTKESLVADVMSEMAMGILPEPDKSAVLLHQFIEQGKRLYFIQAMLPQISDTLLLKYTQEQYDWCINHEARLWSLMIENQFLFETDVAIQKKFIDDGPFTSILSSAAPARLGHFIGWRIVSKYMARNDASLQQLLSETNDQKILKESKYKPRR